GGGRSGRVGEREVAKGAGGEGHRGDPGWTVRVSCREGKPRDRLAPVVEPPQDAPAPGDERVRLASDDADEAEILLDAATDARPRCARVAALQQRAGIAGPVTNPAATGQIRQC